MNKKIIGYARVSTPSQTLGLQIQALQSYAKANGFDIDIFAEKKSGKRLCDGDELWKAITKCKERNLPILVSHVDRLSRSLEGGMFLFHELPQIISINEGDLDESKAYRLFEQAEAERLKVSSRTKFALIEAKKRQRLKRQEHYKDVFRHDIDGAAEYVINYVLGEIYTDPRTRFAKWQEGDLLSCIDAAWANANIRSLPDITICDATEVAECVLTYIGTRKSRRECASAYPAKGWAYDDELGYQVEISN